MNKKMKWIASILAVLTAAATATTILITSCSKQSSDDETDEKAPIEMEVPIVEGSEGILKSGKTNYKLVVDDSCSALVSYAVQEFNTFFKEATRTELAVVEDTGLTYSETSKYISLGKNDVQKSAGVQLDESVDVGGSFLIQTAGESIFVVGYDDYGVLYGTYELMNKLIGFEAFGVDDAYTLNTNVANIPLREYEDLQVPDYAIRKPGFGGINDDVVALRRLRLLDTRNSLGAGGLSGHTSLGFVPVDKYLNEEDTENYHPEWYSAVKNPSQLCYTAHGDPDSLELMVQAALEELKVEMINQPNIKLVNFSHADNRNGCTCAACKEEEKKYKTCTAPFIRFLNRLAEEVYEWMETEEGKPYARDLDIFFYAYALFEVAPVKYDENSESYVAIDDSVKLHEHVIPQLCLTKANYTQPFDSGEKNEQAYENLKKWSAISDTLFTYMYCANYRNFMMPYDTFGAMQNWYQVYNEYGSISMYNLGKGNDKGMTTGFDNFKIYLDAKLSWNVDADFDKLLSDFFNGVYKDAAPYLLEIFNDYRALSRYNAENNSDIYVSPTMSSGPYYMEERIWPRTLLEKWRGLFDDALAAVEYLKTSNPKKYETVYKYIVTERIWVNYGLYELYLDEYKPDEQKKLKAELYGDIVTAGTQKFEDRSGYTLDSLKEALLS